MLHTKFYQNQPSGSWKEKEEVIKGFHHIWAWKPSWSFDQYYLDEFFISLTLKAYMQNLAENGPVVTDKTSSSFICI